jgi:colanic acid/amylovoran biosynthesis glycosyltransferase
MTRAPRIAFIHDSYPPYRQPLFQQLARRQSVQFFFINEFNHRVPAGSSITRGIRIPWSSDYVVAPALLPMILAAHRADPFDAILCPEPSSFSASAAWLAARRLGLPHIVWSGEWFTARHPRRLLMRPLESAIIRSAAVCLAYSSRTARRLERYGARPENIRVIGNASDYDFSPPPTAALEEKRFAWGIGRRPVVSFLGRLMSFKAPDLLVAAIAQLRDLDPFLVIAGSGPMLPGLRVLATHLGVRAFRMTGEEVRSAAEKDILFGLSSVFVLPSRRARIAEPWGLVVNEAARAALPIVVSDHVGSAGDLIRNGETGLVVPEGDPVALAQALRRMLEAPGQARNLGEHARAAAAGFTIERMTEEFQRAFSIAAETAR